MRGEEKPYQMPVAEDSEAEIPHQPPMAQLAQPNASSQQQQQMTKSSNSVQQRQQQQRINNNNLAIQQTLQHLSPIHPQKLSKNNKPDQATAVIVQQSLAVPAHQLGNGSQLLHCTGTTARSSVSLAAHSPSPSAASSSSQSSSVTTPPELSSLTHHPLDSLLTPAASPEEDSLETWIQTVWQPDWLLWWLETPLSLVFVPRFIHCFSYKERLHYDGVRGKHPLKGRRGLFLHKDVIILGGQKLC